MRTSVRARVLSLIEQVSFREGWLSARVASPEELSRDSLLRGAVQLHVDLVFRTSLSSDELLFTAARGYVYLAMHTALPDFPVGVALALPATHAVRRRDELFDSNGPTLDEASTVVIYCIATNPARLGAGRAMVRALQDEVRSLANAPSLVAFSPLTGLRARIIALVDEPAAWSEVATQNPEMDTNLLREQIFELLASSKRPETLPEPARSWISSQGRGFASSGAYRAGTFHRSMGANLVGLADCGDCTDGESMWMRAYHEYDV